MVCRHTSALFLTISLAFSPVAAMAMEVGDVVDVSVSRVEERYSELRERVGPDARVIRQLRALAVRKSGWLEVIERDRRLVEGSLRLGHSLPTDAALEPELYPTLLYHAQRWDMDADSRASQIETIDQIARDITAEADGSREFPFRILVFSEARLLLMLAGFQILGENLVSLGDSLGVALVAQREDRETSEVFYFELRNIDRVLSQGQVASIAAYVSTMVEVSDSVAEIYYLTLYARSKSVVDAPYQRIDDEYLEHNVAAQERLADILFTVAAREEDGSALQDRATDLLLNAIERGSRDAILLLASAHFKDRIRGMKRETLIAVVEDMAQRNIPEAMYVLSKMHADKLVPAPDPQFATWLMWRASMAGLSQAAAPAAAYVMPLDGSGRYFEKVYTALAAAARQGYPDATLQVALMHAGGCYVPRNLGLASRALQQTKVMNGYERELMRVIRLLATADSEELRDLAMAQRLFGEAERLIDASDRSVDFAETQALLWLAVGQYEAVTEWLDRTDELAVARRSELRDAAAQRRTVVTRLPEPCL
jgi:TPR repeat protein